MPAIEFDSLDVNQGFNYNRDVQTPFGFVNSVVIGDGSQIKIDSDLTVKAPDTDADIPGGVAGIISSITWGGGHGDPIKIKFNITTQNKQKIAKLLHEKLNNTNLTVNFTVYEYDPVEKKWFIALQPSGGTALNALIQKDDKKLVMELDKTPATEVVNPQNWGFNLGCMPAQQVAVQSVNFATGYQMTVSKQWGVPVAVGSKAS